MSTAASLPTELLSVVFEHLFSTKDLLCAALVNRNWRAACVSLKSLWRRHWKFIKQSDTDRLRTLAGKEEDIDWFALTSAGVRQAAAWQTGRFTVRFIDLPANFRKLNSVDGKTALITATRPARAGERPRFGGNEVDEFSIVDKATFIKIRTVPSTPGEFPDAANVNGLGHIFSIVDYRTSNTYYYVPEDSYQWLGQPPKMTGGGLKWPKLDGFVFLGGQDIKSEGSVDLHVDGAHTSSPKLAIHEQDTDNLSWVRFGPWKGRRRMIGDEEGFCCDHVLTDDCIITTGYDACIEVRLRAGTKLVSLQPAAGHAASYSFVPPESPTVSIEAPDLVQSLKSFEPSSKIVKADKRAGSEAKSLVCDEDYTSCHHMTPVGKHLFCIVGKALVVFPDYDGPLYGRSKRAPLAVDLGGAPVKFEATADYLVLIAPSAFYVLDIDQFSGSAPPASIKATLISRWGVIEASRYGHREKDGDKGAAANVIVNSDAMYEVLKVDHKWWDKGEKGKSKVDKGESKPVEHFVRIYKFG